MKAEIARTGRLLITTESNIESELLSQWDANGDIADHVDYDWSMKDEPLSESPAKVIEIRVTGIPSEIHILKGDLT